MANFRATSYALIALMATQIGFAKDWDSPPYNYLYQFEMPLAPVKAPTKQFPASNGNPPIDYYEIDIKPFEQQVYPNLGKTRLVGYDGISPGPTMMMTKGREAVVRFINHADRANSVHLHGSYSRSPFDGWAEDITERNQYKDYYYPNSQNGRTLWYHDHAIDHTAENAYFGQAGFYILHDDVESNIPGLPQGIYDIPIALSGKRYNPDGTLWSPEANKETTNLFGDIIHANGQPWPYFKVEPRKYRLRFLNTAISRSFQLWFADPSGARTKFNVVGSDTGLLLNPVESDQLDISMAERWEVVYDFSAYKGQNVTLRNNNNIDTVTPYLHTDKVMRFVVGDTVTDPNNGAGTLPAKLRDVDFPPSHAPTEHTFEFQRQGGEWKINGAAWSDGPTQRVLAKPQRGAVEKWHLKNGAGGWTHPIHIHLIDFQIINRVGGKRPLLPYEKVALKDVVWLNTNEEVDVVARYAPWDGLYMFHCHNLIHEDHEMMAAFNVTALADLGYDEKTSFIDPMEPRYRAKSFSDADLKARTNDFSDASINAKVQFFQSLEAYKNVAAVDSRLEAYWATKPTTLVTSTRSGNSGSGTTAAAGTTTRAATTTAR